MKVLSSPWLTRYNTFGVRATTKQLIRIDSSDDLTGLYQNGFFNQNYYLLSGGSNSLLLQNHYEEPFLYLKIQKKNFETGKNGGVFVFGAGENWDAIVEHQVRNGRGGGIENLSLIPGCVGAAPIQNIGAYGVEQKDFFEYLIGFDTVSGTFRRFSKEDCQFGYRDSIFKRERNIIITEVAYRFTEGAPLILTYGNLKEEVIKRNPNPNVSTVREAVIAIRESKLPNPKKVSNAGSFFKNPIITAENFKSIADRIPSDLIYPLANGNIKIPAGGLIDRAGLKGFKIGKVGTYPLQALVIVNFGGATGREIWSFAQEIISRVEDRFGIRLEPEVNAVGKVD